MTYLLLGGSRHGSTVSVPDGRGAGDSIRIRKTVPALSYRPLSSIFTDMEFETYTIRRFAFGGTERHIQCAVLDSVNDTLAAAMLDSYDALSEEEAALLAKQ